MPPPPPRVFASVSRRTYWVGTGAITLGLAALSWWAGFYVVREAEENAAAQVTTGDPMTEILYSPLGTIVVLGVLQFLFANVLFWAGAWVALKLRRDDA